MNKNTTPDLLSEDLITTERLTLRRPEETDTQHITRAINNWAVVRWLSRVPYPYSDSDAREFIEGSNVAWSERIAFRFVILSRNQIIGGIGLERCNQSAFELGYWIAEPHWGTGFATESIFAITTFAFSQLAASQITASCCEKNDRSIRVLLKTGFSQMGVKLRYFSTLDKELPVIQFLQCRTIADNSI